MFVEFIRVEVDEKSRYSCGQIQANTNQTRLVSIDSQTKKIVVVVVVVIVIVFVVVVNVVHVVVVLIAGVDPRNLPLKFGFNQVINR